MKRLLALTMVLGCVCSSGANMAYWGPAEGNVAGRDVFGGIRVRKELLNVDLRQIVDGKIGVFANYTIVSKGNYSTFRFLFVASSEKPVKPEFILDGKLIPYTVKDTILSQLWSSSQYDLNPDSINEIIGIDLSHGKKPHLSICDFLYTIDVALPAGMHELKVGYELFATGYDANELRHFVFPYYLGSKYTRDKYDSIFVHVLFPNDMDFKSNFDLKIGANNEGFSGNIAGFKGSHIQIDIFKNVNSELNQYWNYFIWINIGLWVVIWCINMGYLRWRKRRGKSLTLSLLWSVPMSILLAIIYFIGMMKYFDYFKNKYGEFLDGDWGKSYNLLVVPFIVAAGIWLTWLILSIVYHTFICDKKWDPLSWFSKK
ncbi:MAG: hypothetical protein IT244_11990 [Bacteroidia bacterium]|nr:hypothetical protein [Bacteroidia bacterium]